MAAGGAAGGAAGAAGAPVMTGNLLKNPGAEAGAGSTDASVVAVPDWIVTGLATALTYGVTDYPQASDAGPATRGLNLFIGGANGDSASMTQTVDLSAYTAAIDGGNATFALSGYLGGYASQDDNVTVTVVFKNAGGATRGMATIGPVLAADRNNMTSLLLKSATGAVPTASRSAVVTMTFTRLSGTANDGYADELSFALSGL